MKAKLLGSIRLEVSGKLIDVERLDRGAGEVYAQPVLDPGVSTYKIELAKRIFLKLEQTVLEMD